VELSAEAFFARFHDVLGKRIISGKNKKPTQISGFL
jgi:hypothetical protein